MIQLTHLGRRSGWAKGDWLPVVSASPAREASHCAFPKQVEEWDRERIVRDYADAAERHGRYRVGVLRALMDQFWSPLTNTLDVDYGGSLDNRLRMIFDVLTAIRTRVGSEFIVGIRGVADEATGGLTRVDGVAIYQRLRDSGAVDFSM